MSGQTGLEATVADEEKRLLLMKRFDQFEWVGCHRRDCLPECRGFDSDTETWNCERYRREFIAYAKREQTT